jgi:hypothetical protein
LFSPSVLYLDVRTAFPLRLHGRLMFQKGRRGDGGMIVPEEEERG